MSQKNPFDQGMVKMQFQPGQATSISVGGFNLDGDEDGCVEVPARLVPELKNHGLAPFQGTSVKKAK